MVKVKKCLKPPPSCVGRFAHFPLPSQMTAHALPIKDSNTMAARGTGEKCGGDTPKLEEILLEIFSIVREFFQMLPILSKSLKRRSMKMSVKGLQQ